MAYIYIPGTMLGGVGGLAFEAVLKALQTMKKSIMASDIKDKISIIPKYDATIDFMTLQRKRCEAEPFSE